MEGMTLVNVCLKATSTHTSISVIAVLGLSFLLVGYVSLVYAIACLLTESTLVSFQSSGVL